MNMESGRSASKNLPASSAQLDGITDNVMGDASRADLRTGVVKLADPGMDMTSMVDMPVVDAPAVEEGFLGRARGWDR